MSVPIGKERLADEAGQLRGVLERDDAAVVAFACQWCMSLRGSLIRLVETGRLDEVATYARRELTFAYTERQKRLVELAAIEKGAEQ